MGFEIFLVCLIFLSRVCANILLHLFVLGVIEITQNRGALHRWLLAQLERSAISRQCAEMAGVESAKRYFHKTFFFNGHNGWKRWNYDLKKLHVFVVIGSVFKPYCLRFSMFCRDIKISWPFYQLTCYVAFWKPTVNEIKESRHAKLQFKSCLP